MSLNRFDAFRTASYRIPGVGVVCLSWTLSFNDVLEFSSTRKEKLEFELPNFRKRLLTFSSKPCIRRQIPLRFAQRRSRSFANGSFTMSTFKSIQTLKPETSDAGLNDPAIGASLCAKGSAGLSLEFDDQRPQMPLIRSRPRGSKGLENA